MVNIINCLFFQPLPLEAAQLLASACVNLCPHDPACEAQLAAVYMELHRERVFLAAEGGKDCWANEVIPFVTLPPVIVVVDEKGVHEHLVDLSRLALCNVDY